jgi:TOBE domain
VLPLGLTPSSITFAARTPGTTSSPVTVTLTNNQSTALTISFAASGQYKTIPSGTAPCGTSLAAHANCTLSVTFSPTVGGTIKGVVTATYSGAPFSPLEVKLSGTGQDFRISALPSSLLFVLAPDVLLLDEPLAALDPKLRKQMRTELKAMQRRVGISFLLVTHDQEEALSMSDRLAVMNEGRIEQVGAPEDLYFRPRTRFVAGFLGAVNWIGGVGIRPEATRIARSAENHGARSSSAMVTDSVFLGDCFQVVVRLASGEEAVAQVHRSSAIFQPGEAVHICWSPADEILVS